MIERGVLDVKPGDEVAVESGFSRPEYRLTRVKRVTPTGRIVLEGTDRVFDKYGREIGGSRRSWEQNTLVRLTPHIRAEYMRRKLGAYQWSKLDDETAMQVAQLLNLA